jgi:F-type H+-transporting ATPase subunit delta
MSDTSLVSKAYAKAAIGLAEAAKVDLVAEFTNLNELINKCNDLELLLFLDVYKVEEKLSILDEIFKRQKYSETLQNFVLFLVQEKRINLLTKIFKEMIVLDDDRKGFLKGVIQGHSEVLDIEVKNKIEKYLEQKTGRKLQFNYFKNDAITAGYHVYVGDLQLDATLDRQIENFKQLTRV